MLDQVPQLFDLCSKLSNMFWGSVELTNMLPHAFVESSDAPVKLRQLGVAVHLHSLWLTNFEASEQGAQRQKVGHVRNTSWD